MTVKLDSLHPLDALYRAAQQYPGGIEALAQRLGMHKATLYNKLRQQATTHRIGFSEELSEILFCLAGANVPGWAAALHAICWRHGHVVVPISTELGLEDDELFRMVCKMMQTMGQVATLLPNAVTANQRDFAAADESIEKCMGTLALLRERLLDARAKADDAGTAFLKYTMARYPDPKDKL